MKKNIFLLLALFVLENTSLCAQDLPTANEITERYFKLSGNFSSIANARYESVSTVFNGMMMKIQIIKDSIHRMRQSFEFYDSTGSKKLKDLVFIYNRGKAIVIENGKKSVFTDKKLIEDMELYSYMFNELAYRTGKYKLEVEGVEEIDSAEYYVVKVTHPSGKYFHNYYSKENGLLIYQNNETEKYHFQDYKLLQGYLYPMTTITETKQGLIYKLILNGVFINESLKSSLFSTQL
jgi:hypothetical protein